MTDSSFTADIPAQVQQAVDAALDLKAEALKVLHLRPVTDFTEYFLILSGSSDRQVQSIANAVQDRLRDKGIRPLHVEGVRQALWVLLDYGDFLVHIFDEERRAFFALERLWGDAPDVTGTFLAANEAGQARPVPAPGEGGEEHEGGEVEALESPATAAEPA